MNRVTPEQIVEAYTSTNIKPIQSCWEMKTEDGKICGCGLTAIMIKNGKIDGFRKLRSEDVGYDELFQYAALNNNLSKSYVHGFVHGFDSYNSYPSLEKADNEEEYNAGFEDGLKSWNAVSAIG